ncbi:hypothetical protein KI387_022038, partial [Taxus chinensis]
MARLDSPGVHGHSTTPFRGYWAELTEDVGEPSVAGQHTDVFSPIWKVEKIITSLHTELAGYRTTECLMRRSHSHSETTAAGHDREPSVHSERHHSRSPRR